MGYEEHPYLGEIRELAKAAPFREIVMPRQRRLEGSPTGILSPQQLPASPNSHEMY
jgi:hypothetical protein